jgi:hypothetical protein
MRSAQSRSLFRERERLRGVTHVSRDAFEHITRKAKQTSQKYRGLASALQQLLEDARFAFLNSSENLANFAHVRR